MHMKCNKCGSDALIKKDDWYQCASCGALIFDTDIKINDIVSPTKQIEEIDGYQQNQRQNIVTYKPDEPIENDVNDNKTDKKSKKENDSDKSETEDKPKKSFLREVIDFCIPIVIAIVISLILKTFVFANAVVPTGSMLNTIQEGDRIIASRLAYITDDPERYDIIIFDYPDNEEQRFVKRVIGLPGETVNVVDGTVYVTTTEGETIQLEDGFITNCVPTGDYGPFKVPEDCYFMMGDNRNTSWDSRYWNNKYVHKDKIVGKVMFRYYPSIDKIE